MPKVEDFPPVVRAEVEARRNPPAEPENNGPMGLLKRLTTGLTRREEEPAKLQPAAPREPKLRQPAPEARRIAAQDPQLYAPRRGQLDEHGRLSPQPRTTQEDDQLEIPAFLRRQAN
jgi:cell division protein FtsZ